MAGTDTQKLHTFVSDYQRAFNTPICKLDLGPDFCAGEGAGAWVGL